MIVHSEKESKTSPTCGFLGPENPEMAPSPEQTPSLLKFIVYLEPGPETQFYRSLSDFYQVSRELNCSNEAHMVRPPPDESLLIDRCLDL